MTLQIDLSPELERRLRDESAKRGVAPDNFVVSTLEMRLLEAPVPPHLSQDESDLLTQINHGTPADVWRRYDELLEKRNALGLSETAEEELSELIDRIDTEHARQLEAVGRLATLRGVPATLLMEQLQLGPRQRRNDGDV